MRPSKELKLLELCPCLLEANDIALDFFLKKR